MRKDDNIKDIIIDELKNADLTTLATAYSYAKNLILYGVNVTEKWDTVTYNSANLERAYRKGYSEGLSRGYNEGVSARITSSTDLNITVYQFMREINANAVIVDRSTKQEVWRHNALYNVKDDVPIQILEKKFCGVTYCPDYPDAIVIYIDNSKGLVRSEYAYY